ncbi:hypothetical protein HQQ81_13325 [Microbacteriaceae bacterium VKM Ac-2854]|nr:hypothetical protein [Microbacteriaceae bacterium VKM Ac-2854]
MPRRPLLIAALAGTVAVACAVGAWAAIASPWGAAVVRDVAAGVAPPSPATIDGSETYLAAELDRIVVPGAVLLDIFGTDTGDGQLDVEYTMNDLGRVGPEGCAEMAGASGIHPSGYRALAGAEFRSELLMLANPATAADEYGALLHASGRCGRIELRDQDYALTGTVDYAEVATGSAAPAGGSEEPVHWFAGTRTDQNGSFTLLITATTGNLLQRFAFTPSGSADSSQLKALAEEVAQRLADGALHALQSRADESFAAGYASGTPTPPNPAPTSRYALALGGLSDASAPALTADFFESAPVPALCEFDAGTLVGGVLPGYTDQDGGVYFGGPYGRSLAAIQPSPSASSAAAAIVVDCNHGGVAWPSSLVFYSADGQVLDSIPVSDILSGGWRDPITDLVIDGDGYRVTWAWEDMDGMDAPRPVSALIRWDGVRLLVTDVVIGERP